jgi:hypothetical protein
MSPVGGWVSYSGDAKIELAVGLLAVAGCVAYAGARLRRPIRAARPPRSVIVLMFSLWVLSLIGFLAGFGVYARQFVHDYPKITTVVADPILPITLLAAAALFGVIMTRTGWRYQTRLGGGVVAAMAAPMIFELPFDLIVMSRTYPPLPPDPALYRAIFFTPLFLIELTTLSLLTLSPMVRVRRSTFFGFALMIGVFGIWALSGFGYPQSALPITMNAISKILAFATASQPRNQSWRRRSCPSGTRPCPTGRSRRAAWLPYRSIRRRRQPPAAQRSGFWACARASARKWRSTGSIWRSRPARSPGWSGPTGPGRPPHCR